MFTPDKAFEVVTKSRIVQLKAPCIKLIELVVEEVKNNFATSFQKVLLIILMGVYCPKSDVLVKYSRLCVVGYFFISNVQKFIQGATINTVQFYLQKWNYLSNVEGFGW